MPNYPCDVPVPHHPLVALLRAGGEALLRFWRQPNVQTRKPDGSQVSEADHAANAVLEAGLRTLWPDIPIISEEGALALPAGTTRYWLLDPLDGTRGFLRGDADYAISLAFIEDGVPVLGALYAPAQDWLMLGVVGQGAWQWRGTDAPAPIALAPVDAALQSWQLLIPSRGATPRIDAYFAGVPIHARHIYPSAVKFMHLVAGMADIYPRFGPTQQWDIAAGNALVHAAGGELMGLDGAPLTYAFHPTTCWEHASFIAGRAGSYARLQQMRADAAARLQGAAHA